MEIRLREKAVFVVLVFLCTLFLGGCGKQEKEVIRSIEQLNDPSYTVGVPEGGAGMYAAEQYLPEANLKTYSGNSSGYLAISQGKLDAFVYDRVMMEFAIASGLENVVILEENLGESMDVAVGISPRTQIDHLRESVNLFLAKARADGTLDEMYERWVKRAEETMPDLPKPREPEGKLTVGTTGTVQPFSYYKGTTLTGYDIELTYRFGAWLNREVEIRVYDYDGIIAAAQAGEIDCIMANLNATEERRKHIEFSDCVYPSVSAVMVRAGENSAAGQDMAREEGFWEGLKDSFRSTFVVEGRWRLVLQGLGVTILISVWAGIFGLCLGFPLCMLRRVERKPIQWICRAFVRLVQGTPIVVFLMILYYGVFGSVDIDGILVAVIGFAIHFAAYSSEMMRAGIETVDKGQTEAALAMGYTKTQAFFKIVFPQAAGNFLPVLKGEFISMVKMTSVVGFIAVQDLTKVSDIIRSRTMEAFFPLIVTAVIYFAVANGMTAVLSFAERKAAPNRKKRVIKGVRM